MRAAIYARTCRAERRYNTVTIPNQVEYCHDLARRHNLAVERENVFTDVELAGTLLPTCWAVEGDPGRPALSALIERIQSRRVSHVLVRRADKLGTDSRVLTFLLDLFTHYGVKVVVSPESLGEGEEASGRFAAAILRPCLQYYTAEDAERRTKLKAKRIEEAERLRAKLERLQAEIVDLERDPLV